MTIFPHPNRSVAGNRPDRCTDWCDHIGCEPELGAHTSTPLVATKGGPMADRQAVPGAADVVFTVGVDRGATSTTIGLRIRYMERDVANWYAPKAVNDLLPRVPMNSTRARHLAELLLEAADAYDHMTGSAQ